MPERENQISTREAEEKRSTEDIRHSIANERKNISQTVNQIGERIKEKMNWRGYVKDSPYWALGAAAGLGYLASRVFIRRTTPVERIMRPIAKELHHSLGGLLAGAACSGLIKVSLISIGTKVAASWIKNAISAEEASPGVFTGPPTSNDSTGSPSVDTQTSVRINN